MIAHSEVGYSPRIYICTNCAKGKKETLYVILILKCNGMEWIPMLLVFPWNSLKLTFSQSKPWKKRTLEIFWAFLISISSSVAQDKNYITFLYVLRVNVSRDWGWRTVFRYLSLYSCFIFLLLGVVCCRNFTLNWFLPFVKLALLVKSQNWKNEYFLKVQKLSMIDWFNLKVGRNI